MANKEHELIHWDDYRCKNCGLEVGYWPGNPICVPPADPLENLELHAPTFADAETQDEFQVSMNPAAPVATEETAQVKCLYCGQDYSKQPLDVVLSKEQWLLLNPDDGGVLCAACIVKRAAELPHVINLSARITFADEFDSPVPQPAGTPQPLASMDMDDLMDLAEQHGWRYPSKNETEEEYRAVLISKLPAAPPPTGTPEQLRELAEKWRKHKAELYLPNQHEYNGYATACGDHANELEALIAGHVSVAHLIERTGLCFGFCDHKPKWVAFTDISALRFSRRSDAIRFIESFREQVDLENVLVTEHLWSDKNDRT